MRFYGYFRSSAAYRCRIALNLKGIDYEFVPVHLRRGGGEQHLKDYLELNPEGLVPVLEAGDFRLSQSLSIIEWLDETHPDPPLLPGDAHARARVRSFAQAIACDTHPLQNLRVLDYLRNELRQDEEHVTNWCRHWIQRGLAACEAVLARHNHGQRYCFGATPGLADICLVPQVFSADRFGVELSAMPNVLRVTRSCEQHHAFAEAHPARQPDSE
jgi:maleylacetoacetate isomerase